MEQPKVSILMAVYNATPFLNEAIGSVFEQTYSNWELICVNDGSIDNSLNILSSFEKQDARIKVINQTNAGAANARNAALKISTGKYVCILDADDKLGADYLEKTVGVALQNPENDCVVPEMFVWYWTDESKSYSCNGIFKVPTPCDGRKALILSIPWRIHALALWNGEMVRKIGYRTDGYITSDEVTSRDFFAQCRQVVPSPGRYYYRYNEQSITKKISPKPIEKLLTNLQLKQIACDHNLSTEDVIRINTEFFFELITWTMYYLRNKQNFSDPDNHKSLNIIREAYSRREINLVKPQNLTAKIKKITLGYNYQLFMLICRTMLIIKPNGQ